MRIDQRILHNYPVGQKFRRNRSISHGLGDTSNFKFYHFYSKIQNSRHFWKEEKFLKIEQSILDIYPVVRKFHRNRSISHGLGDTSNFKFYHFCQKFKMAGIFEKRKNWKAKIPENYRNFITKQVNLFVYLNYFIIET